MIPAKQLKNKRNETVLLTKLGFSSFITFFPFAMIPKKYPIMSPIIVEIKATHNIFKSKPYFSF